MANRVWTWRATQWRGNKAMTGGEVASRREAEDIAEKAQAELGGPREACAEIVSPGGIPFRLEVRASRSGAFWTRQ